MKEKTFTYLDHLKNDLSNLEEIKLLLMRKNSFIGELDELQKQYEIYYDRMIVAWKWLKIVSNVLVYWILTVLLIMLLMRIDIIKTRIWFDLIHSDMSFYILGIISLVGIIIKFVFDEYVKNMSKKYFESIKLISEKESITEMKNSIKEPFQTSEDSYQMFNRLELLSGDIQKIKSAFIQLAYIGNKEDYEIMKKFYERFSGNPENQKYVLEVMRIWERLHAQAKK